MSGKCLKCGHQICVCEEKLNNVGDGWRDVRKELPQRQEGVRYSQVPCIVYRDKNIEILVFNHEHMCWDDRYGDDFVCDIGDVIAWRPLPNPPDFA